MIKSIFNTVSVILFTIYLCFFTFSRLREYYLNAEEFLRKTSYKISGLVLYIYLKNFNFFSIFSVKDDAENAFYVYALCTLIGAATAYLMCLERSYYNRYLNPFISLYTSLVTVGSIDLTYACVNTPAFREDKILLTAIFSTTITFFILYNFWSKNSINGQLK